MSVVGRWLGGLLAALAVLVLPAAPTWAHSDLKSSDPADGATLASAPVAVSFTFNERLLAQGNAVVITELATGTRLEVGTVEVDGDTVSVGWPEGSAAGEYRAAYRVVSADGHPIDGSITFTLESSAGSAPSRAGSASPGSSSPEATPTAPASTAGTPSPAVPSPVPVGTQSALPEPDQADAGVLVWVLGIGVVVLAGAAATAWFARGARRP